MTGETSERFRTQPPVRPAVIFGSDPARELEVGSCWWYQRGPKLAKGSSKGGGSEPWTYFGTTASPAFLVISKLKETTRANRVKVKERGNSTARLKHVLVV